jgi:hypothetical protein
MSKKWTEEEINFLIENYKKEGSKYCSDVLNRKIYAVRKKANMLNISYSKNKRIYEKEFIQKVVNDSVSYKEVLIKMGLRAAGGNYKILKKYINLYGLSISHFESPEEVSKRNLFKDKISLDEILVENSTYSRTSLKTRLYDDKILERKCSLCGQDENWNGMKISLILDHINGIYNDNRIENLRIVCPNCNAGLDTHAGKNNRKNKEIKVEKEIKKRIFYEKERKVERPSYDILINEISMMGYSATGRKYGVSDNAIRKWIKYYEKIKDYD